VSAPWDRRSLEEQARVVDLALERWLPAVTSAAPFWARRVASEGIDPGTLQSSTSLAGLPPVREADLLADGPGAPGTVMLPSEAQVKSYSGTEVLRAVAGAIRREGPAGKRTVMLREYQPVDLRRAGVGHGVVVASSRSDLDRLNRVGARAARVLGLHDRDVLLSAVPAGPTLAAARIAHLAQGASITALHARGHGDDLADVAHAARLLSMTVLVVELDEAVPLARTLRGSRLQPERLRRVVTYGPPPGDDLRAEIGEAFGGLGARVDVRALWGPEFGRTMWAECEEGPAGLHTSPDLEVLEVLDPMTGEPTAGDGDLTLTSVGWHGTGLVRVQTGTWVDPLRREPCPACGRTVPRLEGEMAPGAWQLPLDGDARVARHVDLRGVPAVLARTGGVRAWRAEVRGPDERTPRDRLVVEVAGDLARAELAGLEQRLEAACGIAPHLVLDVHPDDVRRSIDEVGGVFADLR
jgi:phenylacetate-coenzyme A ligase PaaK-like adenylate-forming protein